MTALCTSFIFPDTLIRSATWPPASPASEAKPLIHRENLREFVGDDPALQAEVLGLCRDVLAAYVPQLREAVLRGDSIAIQRIAHGARGSLGMLGLPQLEHLSLAVERQQESASAECWHEHCRQFLLLLQRLHQELHDGQNA